MTLEKSKRENINQYFMKMADLVSTRSTCCRRGVGAVLVKDKQVIATGYNGAPSMVNHCTSETCIRKQLNIPSGEKPELCVAVHAEANCICHAAYNGVSTKNSILYCNTKPCLSCTKLIINSGIKKVFYREDYNSGPLAERLVKESGIIFEKI